MERRREPGKVDVVKATDTVETILTRSTERLSREIRKISMEIGYPVYCCATYTNELWLCRRVEDAEAKLALRKEEKSLRARLSSIFRIGTSAGSAPEKENRTHLREALVGVMRLDDLEDRSAYGNAPWSLEVFGENNLPHLQRVMERLEGVYGRAIIVKLTGDEITMATIAEYNVRAASAKDMAGELR